MPSIRSFALFEGVTETVVPGQTRISPPLDNCNIVVSLPEVRDCPAPNCLSATTISPAPLLTGRTSGAEADKTCGDWKGGFPLPAFASVFESESPGGFSRTIRRLPAASQL